MPQKRCNKETATGLFDDKVTQMPATLRLKLIVGLHTYMLSLAISPKSRNIT